MTRRFWAAIEVRSHVPCALALVALLVAGCSDPIRATHLYERYVLSSVDGNSLPYISADVTTPDGTKIQRVEVADTIRFLSHTDFQRSTAHSVLFSTGITDNYVNSSQGTYYQDGEALTLEWTSYPDPTTESFVVSGGEIRAQRWVGPLCAGCLNVLVDFIYEAR